MRLRFKLMAALLATGLGSVALVGGVAYVSVNYKVDSLRRQQAAEHFHTYMTAYLAEYGDWQTAIATESFDRFVRRQEGARPAGGADGRPGGELPSEMLERMPPRVNNQARPTPPQPDGALPPPGRGQTAHDPAAPAARRPERGAPPASQERRTPREGYGPPPEGRDQRGAGERFGPPPQGEERRPPHEDDGPPPEGREQRGPDDRFGPPPHGEGRRPPRDGYGPPPHEGREGREAGGPDQRFGPPPHGEGRRPPREGYGHPPEGRDQRGVDEGFGPPPQGEGRRPPHGGYGPPPEGRDQGGAETRPVPQAQGQARRPGDGPPPERDAQPGPDEAAARPQGAYGRPRPATVAETSNPGGAYGNPPAPVPAPRPGVGEPAARPFTESGRVPPEDRPPPRRGDGPPPFRFILTDADFKVLLGAGQFRLGEALPENLRATARPIIVKEKPVAYMSSEGTLAPTPQEQKYLDALYNSLLWGIAAAAGLATLLGVLLSRGLSRSLSGLTQAVKGMHKGELRQEVPVKGKDEVAALATAFNEMSAQLAQSHEELNASHATILEQAEQLRELSIRDALTQLYNRRHFDEQANTLFNQAVRHKRPLTLVICDIDHFKKINDTYSHATGDVVLRHVGNILRKHMRLSDLVARYGGEEFVMAFPETPGPQAAALCEKLRTLIESFPWHEVHPELKVTMSMGVYADIAAGSAETMLQKADALLYRAKETGRNRVCFA
jgi:diguanylate cyclase (GGDEF)-like protein